MTETTDPLLDGQRAYRPVGATSRALGYFIFTSRWLQAPLYLGLIVAQAVYVVVFMIDLWHLMQEVFGGHGLDESGVMLAVLGLIDVVMIANLLIMVIIGGYEIFVSKIRVDGHPDEPDWLSHVNANLLKIKLSISIISISSIHLLKTFIEVGPIGGTGKLAENVDKLYTSEGVMWQVVIHLAFIVSALALAWIDRLQNKTLMEAAAANVKH
nr:TIGR00645 family protein [Lysinibacter cavernae]